MDDDNAGGGNDFTLTDPYIQMEMVVEMLKLLDYENKFCKNKGFKPLSKVYFAQASPNPSE
jgi:hypothetical protein